MLTSSPLESRAACNAARLCSTSVAVPDTVTHKRRRCSCASSRGVFATAQVEVPQSREEVVSRAGESIRDFLQKRKSGPKAFKKRDNANAAVEISLADETPESVVRLVADLLAALGDELSSSATLAFHDIQAALIASERFSNAVLSTQDFEARKQSGALFLIGIPASEEETTLPQIRWKGGAVVLVALDTNSLAAKPSSLRKSFQTLLAFEPFATRGLLRTTEGLIFKQPQGEKAGAWLICKRKGRGFELIGRTSKRPTASEVELAFYNSSAASSPVVQALKAIRSLAPGGEQKRSKS